MQTQNNTTTDTTITTTSKQKETLCWTCKFCTGCTRPNPRAAGASPDIAMGGVTTDNHTAAAATTAATTESKFFTCPWAHDGKPVPGWTATKTDLKVSPDNITTSYMVEKCPYYIPDLEAQILSLSMNELAKHLELSEAFVRKHIKLSRQILYTYTIRYPKEVKIRRGRTGKDHLSTQARYKLRKSIVREILLCAQDEVTETTGDSSDEIRYKIALNQTISGCLSMLKQLERTYKRCREAAKTNQSVD